MLKTIEVQLTIEDEFRLIDIQTNAINLNLKEIKETEDLLIFVYKNYPIDHFLVLQHADQLSILHKNIRQLHTKNAELHEDIRVIPKRILKILCNSLRSHFELKSINSQNSKILSEQNIWERIYVFKQNNWQIIKEQTFAVIITMRQNPLMVMTTTFSFLMITKISKISKISKFSMFSMIAKHY
jgi:hypothetical protein